MGSNGETETTNLPTVRSIAPPAPALKRETDFIASYADLERVAKACAASGFYRDAKDASQAVVKMLAGREMGVGPIQAMSSIHVVEGKPTAGASLLAALVKRSGRYDYRVITRTDEACELAWYEHGQRVGSSSFSAIDAERAGLWGKQNWGKYPRAMLFARALTEGIRVYAPDAAGGVIYTPEEIRPDMAVTEDAEPVAPERDVTPVPVHTTHVAADATGGYEITAQMRKRMYAMAKERYSVLGIDDVDPVGLIKSVLRARGIESSKDITSNEQYDEVCDGIASWDPPPLLDDFDSTEPELKDAPPHEIAAEIENLLEPHRIRRRARSAPSDDPR